MTCSWSRLCTSLFFYFLLLNFTHTVLNVFRLFMHVWSAVCPPLLSESLIHECIGFRRFFLDSLYRISLYFFFGLRSHDLGCFSFCLRPLGTGGGRGGGGKQVLGYESGAFITGIESNSCVSLTFFHLVS